MGKDLLKNNNKLISNYFKKILFNHGLFLILILIVIILSILSPVFLTTSNLLIILRQISVIGIAAMGMTFVIVSAGIDLSIGATASLAGVMAATVGQYNNLVVLAVLSGILVGALSGTVNGFVISKLKVTPFICTLGMTTIIAGISLIFTGGRPVSNHSQNYSYIGSGKVGVIPVPVIILISVILLSAIILRYFRFGRYVYALGGNETSARLSGINTTKITFLVYVICGACAGLAGVVLSARVMSAVPTMALGLELDAIAAVVIGGTSLFGGVGSIPGVFIGTLIVGVIGNGLDLLNVSGYYQQIVRGAIIIFAVALQTYLNKNK